MNHPIQSTLRITLTATLLALLCCTGAFAGGTFNINTGTGDGDGYTWESPRLTITTNGTYIITGSGTTTTNSILVNNDITANITIENVNIYASCAFFISSGATVNLTLSGTNVLKSGADQHAGLEVSADATLTITGTSTDKLTATGGYKGAGIGGGRYGSGGNITISGGTVAANGSGYVSMDGGNNGAGIGGGSDGDGGIITISGGTVTATGSNCGAGIGGGSDGDGGIITISGGTVTAIGGGSGAGIGGGDMGSGGTITISGGTVTATGGFGGAGIGGGIYGDGGAITISGGTVTAIGGGHGAGIGGGNGIFGGGGSGSIIISGGTVTANSGDYGGAGIGNGYDGGYGGDGGIITISGGTVTATGSNGGADIGKGGGYDGVPDGTTTISGGSISAGSINPQPTNGNGDDVYLNTLTADSGNSNKPVTAGSIDGTLCAATANAATGVYGIKDVKTDADSKIYLYLPASDENELVKFAVDDKAYGKSYKRESNDSNSETLEEMPPSYNISLDRTGTHAFDGETYGYTPAPTALTVTVTNADFYATGDLTVSLSGDDAGSFSLSTTTLNSIAVSETGSFTVEPQPGLSAKTHEATVTVENDNGINESFDVSFTVTQKNIDITGVTKTYDGTTDAASATVSFSGLVDGESLDLTTDYTVSGAFSDHNAGGGKTVAGIITLTASPKASNYNLVDYSYDLTGQSIAKKSIAVTGGTVTPKPYDGTAAATVTGVTFDGLETLAFDTDYTVSSGATFDDANVGDDKPVTVTVTLNDIQKANNYTLTNGNGNSSELTGNITPKDIAITGGTVTARDYDGTDAATVTGVTFDGLENGETLAVTIDYTVSSGATFDDANVGDDKPVTVTVTLNDTPKANNYTLTNGNGNSSELTGNITPKDISITGGTVTARDYDGTDAATVTGVTFDGLETLVFDTDYTVSSGATFNNANVGDDKPVTVTVTLNDIQKANNYTLINGNGNNNKLTGNITAKEITITGLGADDKPYDGTTAATVTGTETAVLDGNLDGDNLTLTSGVANFDTKHVKDNKTVTFTEYSLGGSAAGNYSLTDQPETVKANITPKNIAITGGTVTPKPYDGTDVAVVTGVSFSGLENGETLAFDTDYTVSSSATFDNANVGDDKPVTVTVTLNDIQKANNYSLTNGNNNSSKLTGNITKKEITVTPDAKSKIYGQSDPALTYTYDPELIAGDEFTGVLSRIAGENPGTYLIEQNTLELSDNYDLTFTTGVLFTIDPTNPRLLQDLEDAIVCAGESYTFAVVAEGDNLSYEWYRGNSRITGANKNTYTITNAESGHSDRYYVIVRSDLGSYRSSVYSKEVRLWVASQLPETLRFTEYPSTAITGNTYHIKLAGYSDVTQYLWSYRVGATLVVAQNTVAQDADAPTTNDGVTFSPVAGGVGQNETLATFGDLSVGQGLLTVTLEHPCGARQATQTILVQYPTGVDQVAEQAIRVFPNPTAGIIKVSGTTSNQIIRIVDITGSLKGTYLAQDGETTIDLSGFTKGTYLIQYGGKTVKVVKK